MWVTSNERRKREEKQSVITVLSILYTPEPTNQNVTKPFHTFKVELHCYV